MTMIKSASDIGLDTAAELAVQLHLAVREMPGSGSGTELLAWAGLDADHIVTAARRLVHVRRRPE
jgi:hypothetical protein